ncbi:MAG TPA: NUDIX hydrolase [Acidimicrobiales bacterium]|nr:NUDIX hydrolase [Acidimicrobiales bacterium]
MDGLFLSPTPPWGASVLVLRDRSVLLLWRGCGWTPPAITRLPDEPIAVCAARALDETVGLTLALWPVADVDPGWAVFVASVSGEPLIRPDRVCESFAWVPLDEARRRCTQLVSTTLDLVA